MTTLVVGGGLSGLACAFELHRAGHPVRLLEASDHLGGVVRTLEADGFRFETGPNTVLPSARRFRTLCDELGIADRLVPSSPEARARYLWFGGRLVALPLGPGSFLRTPLLSFGAKLRLLAEPLRGRGPASERPEPGFGDFLRHRLGPQPTDRMAAAFVRGVYAGDLNRLGARSAFPRLWSLVEEHGSLLRGALARRRVKAEPLPGPAIPRGRLVSFGEGLGALPAALTRALEGRIHTGAAAQRLERKQGGGAVWCVESSAGTFEADHLVLATPAHPSARLLESLAAPGELTSALDRVPHPALRVVHVGYAPGAVEPRPDGFGFLVPPGAWPDAPGVLGMLFTANLFAGRVPSGCFSVSAFYKEESFEAQVTEAEAGRRASEDLARALGLSPAPEPAVVRTLCWERAIPQYEIGHADRIAELQREVAARWPDLHLAGNFSAGVSVEDVLARGHGVARSILEGSGGLR